MKSEERAKLEEVKTLLNDLQKDFLHTYKKIHEIMDGLELEEGMEEYFSDEDEGEVDEDLMNHIDEIFGEED